MHTVTYTADNYMCDSIQIPYPVTYTHTLYYIHALYTILHTILLYRYAHDLGDLPPLQHGRAHGVPDGGHIGGARGQGAG